MIAVLWVGFSVAQADDFDLQLLGQPVQGAGWVCPEGRGLCTRSDRILSLPGTWSATLDDHGNVGSLTFSVFFVDLSLPYTDRAQSAADPWAEARAAVARFEAAHRGWDVVSETAGDPSALVYARAGERRTLAAWTTTLTNEEEQTGVTAAVHLRREASGALDGER